MERWFMCLVLFTIGITVDKAQGAPDLSVPTYAIGYRGSHIYIFQTPSASVDPIFYYTPACVLVSNRTHMTAVNAESQYATVTIGLWDEEYINYIRTYVSQKTGILHPNIWHLPFKWMRIDAVDNLHLNRLGNKWKSFANHPQTVSLRIRCSTSDSCDKIKKSLTSDTEHFAPNVHLAFAYHLPNTTRSTLNIHSEHVQASHTFQAMDYRYPQADYVFMQASAFDELVRETLWSSIESSLNGDEFVSDEQLDDLMIRLSRQLRYNTTLTAEFTPAMWQTTFWHDESQRPDIIASGVEALLSSGKNWLKKIMRGENVTNEAGTSLEISPSLAKVIADVKTGKGHVRWNGNNVIIEPFPLHCIALGHLRGKFNLTAFPIFITKRTSDYVAPAYSRGSAATQSAERDEDRHFNQTLGETILTAIKNLTAEFRMFQTSNRYSLEPKGTATWLMRDADTMWSLNHTVITAAVQTEDDSSVCQQLTATSNSFGEFSLPLPRKTGLQLVLTFSTAGYYPIVLRSVRLNQNQDAAATYMEPLLFISMRLSGHGAASGIMYDLKSYSTRDYELSPLANVKLDFRSGMNSHTGSPIITIQTSMTGTWNASLSAGHYTVTASKHGYITMTFTVVILGGKTNTYNFMAMSPILDSGQIRIVSLVKCSRPAWFSMTPTLDVQLPTRSGMSRSHVNFDNPLSPDGFVRYVTMFGEIQSVLITKQLAGDYRVNVNNYWYSRWGTLSSCAAVQLYTGNKLRAEYFWPNRRGNACIVKIDGANLKAINEMKYEDSTSSSLSRVENNRSDHKAENASFALTV